MTKENNQDRFSSKGRVVFFATGNSHKFHEARMILTNFNIAVGMLKMKDTEIQSASLVKIAQNSALNVFKRCNLPIIIEDAGFFVEALNGFPGPYAAYVYKTIGNKGLLKLMQKVKNRKARFCSAIAYCDNAIEIPVVFEDNVDGNLTNSERMGSGISGFGFDPVFQPSGSTKTFAEMTIEEKNSFSHRAKAIRKFAIWYRQFQ